MPGPTIPAKPLVPGAKPVVAPVKPAIPTAAAHAPVAAAVKPTVAPAIPTAAVSASTAATTVPAAVTAALAPIVAAAAVVAAAAPAVEPTETDPTSDGNIFVLGASATHLEPLPPPVALPPVAGRRSVAFAVVATAPGGIANVTIEPAVEPTDALPINVYAVFILTASIPTDGTATTDFFFTEGVYSSEPSTAADASGDITITVPGVKPSLQPYTCQLILEYPAGS